MQFNNNYQECNDKLILDVMLKLQDEFFKAAAPYDRLYVHDALGIIRRELSKFVSEIQTEIDNTKINFEYDAGFITGLQKALSKMEVKEPKPKDEGQTIVIPNYEQWWNGDKEKKE